MHDRRQLEIARSLLEQDLRYDTEVSLFGFTLRASRQSPGIWTVFHDELEAPVDYVKVDATISAVNLLDHLKNLREVVETRPVTESSASP
ncbi:hypothetical protein Htur_5284 (plasmid) [Haloterrigena turkmenica DSM 5511]|uniref:Uncharacterized protein n=1 Tax=Haloterrigena turkmenica (strain ATCC 51198 / DSM 5511 / JCM 9101 / NCIMB 13204 / VKM B-1734 / 4k) TaxID=543526 RepID=D2S3R4_HALTV|nr:hypothetical protein [Haloterrigena turkmenica]ADB64011.1 hypothetical protein Htur_5284 [Haloterrigena turkmenica DSM 5511]